MKTVLEAWSPATQHERKAVLLELECILASPHFSNSKRYPALLRYIVERALEGRTEFLKERTLGIEVFQRPADYDTNADPVVRYTAGEVRKRLSVYYHQNEASHGVYLSLPVGTYVPEFLKEHEPEVQGVKLAAPEAVESQPPAPETRPALTALPPQAVVVPPGAGGARRISWPAFLVMAMLLTLAAAAVAWRYAGGAPNAVDQFWGPARQDQSSALLCVGGNVFDRNHFSGTMTAGKDSPYPFVSMQLASAIARVGGLLDRQKTSYQIQASAPTPLEDLRDRPVVLLGGYNNPWTMRLVQTLRFQFPAEPFEGIVDRDHPGRQWTRDKSQPYASTDDYALIARFRDARTGSVVFLLAGLGRNGTEGAAQFAANPVSMEQVSRRLGRRLGSGNLEVVIKVNVIDGKTGAPSIEDLYAW